MKRENTNKAIKKKSNQYGRMLIAAVVTAMVLCMGCNGEKQATDNSSSESTTEAVGMTEQIEEAAVETTGSEEFGVTVSVETEMKTESESVESDEPEDEEDMELIALYNNSIYQSELDFANALRNAGYDQICLIGGNSEKTSYFSVIHGNHYTMEYLDEAYLYLPYTPTEFSCDNETIAMHYWKYDDVIYDEESDTTSAQCTELCFYDEEFFCDIPRLDSWGYDMREWYKLQENQIQLECVAFEGDDVPVNISVTFEDGSTQEITIYLTRHRELYDPYLPYAMTAD